ncbi:nitrite/sulfite reductase [Lachnospiraceae bacterium LCP25S3_G4]
MEQYKELLKEEVRGFREAGHRFLAGELTKNEFKGMSGGMGVYAQQDQKSFMIRLRTPSGIITREHLKLILNYTKIYQLKKVHLTTRQAVQLHDLSIDDVCDIMLDAIEHHLFTRGGGGNFPRNVALSPLAGVERGEAFDVTPYALQVGEYFLRNATSYKLPRKLKVAFSSSNRDTACATINDIGFLAIIENGTPLLRMWLAGGLGGGPALAIPYPELVRPEEVLYYVEAMVQTFITEGDYEHKAKARTRFIPRRMGEKAFLEAYGKQLELVREKYHFEGHKPVIDSIKEWKEEGIITKNSVCIGQKQEGLFTVVLHPICGQLATEDLELITEFVNKVPRAEVRISMEEDMYLRNLTNEEAIELLDKVGNHMMKTPIQMTLACVGTPTCQMGILQSQKLCKEIIAAVNLAELSESRLPMIHISGCPNSCSRHQVAEIGFAGRKVKVHGELEDAFEMHIGGKTSAEETRMGVVAGVLLAKRIPDFIVELGQMLKKTGKHAAEIFDTEEFESLVNQYKIS